MSLKDIIQKGYTTERRPIKPVVPRAPKTFNVQDQAPVEETNEGNLKAAEGFGSGVTPAAAAAAVLFNFQDSAAPTVQNFNNAFQGSTIGNRHILIISPKTNSEVINIVEHLKTNEAVIVNFEGIQSQDSQRRIDFLSGVVAGIGGQIKQLDTHKFILTPNGIGVK